MYIYCTIFVRTRTHTHTSFIYAHINYIVHFRSSKLLVKLFRANLISARPIGNALGTGEVLLSSVLDSKGLYDAWVPLEGPTQGSLIGEVHVVMLFTATRRTPHEPSILNPPPAHTSFESSSSGISGGGQRRQEFFAAKGGGGLVGGGGDRMAEREWEREREKERERAGVSRDMSGHRNGRLSLIAPSSVSNRTASRGGAGGPLGGSRTHAGGLALDAQHTATPCNILQHIATHSTTGS